MVIGLIDVAERSVVHRSQPARAAVVGILSRSIGTAAATGTTPT